MKKHVLNFGKVVLVAVVVSFSSGCFMFSKKNRCGDCPKWHKLDLKDWTELLQSAPF